MLEQYLKRSNELTGSPSIIQNLTNSSNNSLINNNSTIIQNYLIDKEFDYFNNILKLNKCGFNNTSLSLMYDKIIKIEKLLIMR